MPSFFSQRNAPPPSQLRYDVPKTLRERIWAIVESHLGGHAIEQFSTDIAELLLKQYGSLTSPANRRVHSMWDNAAKDHFLACPDEQALDFVEACFQLPVQCGGQRAVDEINAAFRQEGVGYELTKFLGPATAKGSVIIGKQIAPDLLPRIVRVDEQSAHAEMVAPALSLLTNPVLAVANGEMLKAFSDHRAGRHEDAITACGSAFESVLKTICDQKGWAYDKDKDTCSKLVDTCHVNGLFPSFYVDLFKRVGTVRNKLGDAHGRGPVPQHDVETAHAEHMLHMTCSHIILLCRLAGLH